MLGSKLLWFRPLLKLYHNYADHHNHNHHYHHNRCLHHELQLEHVLQRRRLQAHVLHIRGAARVSVRGQHVPQRVLADMPLTTAPTTAVIQHLSAVFMGIRLPSSMQDLPGSLGLRYAWWLLFIFKLVRFWSCLV